MLETVKNELAKEYGKVWKDNKHMVDYCVKKTDVVVKLRGQYLFTVDKPGIKTSFCFGYGYCGVSNEEDYTIAANMAEHAKTHEEYFIEENMKQLEKSIESLNDNRLVALIRGHYTTKTNLVNLEYFHNYDTELVELAIKDSRSKGDIAFVVNDEDKALIIQAYEEAKKNFEKRLKTYLKRYGLSKIDAWSYLVD